MVFKATFNNILDYWISYNIRFKFKGPSWSWSYGSWFYNYQCSQCLFSTKVVSLNLAHRGVLDIFNNIEYYKSYTNLRSTETIIFFSSCIMYKFENQFLNLKNVKKKMHFLNSNVGQGQGYGGWWRWWWQKYGIHV
jgi:hypothetical protein